MKQILDIAFSGFWNFIGMALLLNGLGYLIGTVSLRMWSRFMRMLMVRKHGWPPNGLDADGDHKPLNK